MGRVPGLTRLVTPVWQPRDRARDELADLRARTARLEARVAVLETQLQHPPVRHRDQQRLSRLLPAIAGALGSAPFTSRELFEDDPRLAGVQIVLGDLTPRRVGKLFRRAAGQIIDGALVEVVGTELHVNVWRVLQVVSHSAIPPPRSRDPV
jgi:hypothetical protein